MSNGRDVLCYEVHGYGSSNLTYDWQDYGSCIPVLMRCGLQINEAIAKLRYCSLCTIRGP